LKPRVKQLEGNPKQRKWAEKQFADITHPSAVPAIVDMLCQSNQSLAEFGVKTLGQIPEFQASRALAGIALFSQWKAVRKEAIEQLKKRKREEFVPDYLLLLTNPIRLQSASETPESKWKSGQAEFRINWDYVWVEENA